ncbi:MAG: ComEC/Rec2 family competence protein [Eubacteriales bacterium]|nr:ComEC/Rec2 family competence protein [Eubacteriales bacterium]
MFKNKLFVNILLPAFLLFGISYLIMENEGANKEAVFDAPTMQAHFIDVGQGDSCLVKLPDGKRVLIDAGDTAAAEDVIRHIRGEGVKKIDYVIATHPHADHIGALSQVIKTFEIGSIYMPKASHTTRAFESLLVAISDKGLKVNTAKAGVLLFDEGNISAGFLAPVGDDYENLNNFSAVLKITYGNVSFLFTGDAEALSEKEMIDSGQNLRSTVLKVGHHGSNTSSTTEFLKAVSPKVAVISCGEGNSYGHPSEKVLKRLQASGIEIYRTDQMGTIKIYSDGEKIIIDK